VGLAIPLVGERGQAASGVESDEHFAVCAIWRQHSRTPARPGIVRRTRVRARYAIEGVERELARPTRAPAEIAFGEHVRRAAIDALNLARLGTLGGRQLAQQPCREPKVSRLVRQAKPRPDIAGRKSALCEHRSEQRLTRFGLLLAAEPERASLGERRIAIARALPMNR